MKNPYAAFIFCTITIYIEMILLKYFNQYNYWSWLIGYTHACIYSMYLEKIEK